MQINTVKKISSGFLLNDSAFAPEDLENSDYQAIQKWISEGGIIDDSDELQRKKDEKIAICDSYLESTDWQAAAFIKYKRPVDSDVEKKCLLAKKKKSEIKACETLEQLEEINLEF